MSKDRRFPPSAKKLRKARESGDFVRSRQLSSSVASAVCVIVLYRWANSLYHVETHGFSEKVNADDVAASALRIASSFRHPLIEVGFMLLVMSLVAVGTELIQTRGNLSSSVLRFDLKNLSPIKGLKRIFNVDDELSFSGCILGFWGAFGRSLIKISVASAVTAYSCLPILGASFSARASLTALRSSTVHLGLAVVGISLISAVLELYRAIRRRNKRLMMDFNELTQELKESEGNQEVKMMRKHAHQEIMREADLNRVRSAKILLTSGSG